MPRAILFNRGMSSSSLRVAIERGALREQVGQRDERAVSPGIDPDLKLAMQLRSRHRAWIDRHLQITREAFMQPGVRRVAGE
ncbi:MAG TPA: hypothetical protein PKB10_05660 [Tepidisphaeraceae bacterium]|nr:hypothetical protein [Tepidisphaeraceae bacterium]